MYVASTLPNGLEDIINPTFRTIHFENSPAQLTVVTLLRNAWTVQPPSNVKTLGAEAALDKWMSVTGRSAEKDHGSAKFVEQYPEKDDVETEWRKSILFMYNHLFSDIGKILPGVNHKMGHHHPPNHTSFCLTYDELSSMHSWDTGMVILPAWMDRDVWVQVLRVKDGEDDREEYGVFGAKHMKEAWFIGAGMRMVMKIEYADKGAKRKGVAAVFVAGILCNNVHVQQ